MSVKGFPGKGVLEVSFFPSAICEDECGSRSVRVGQTNSRGSARFRVKVPGTFINQRGGSSYFRDGERVEVNVTWEGPRQAFEVAYAKPEPIIVRTHEDRSRLGTGSAFRALRSAPAAAPLLVPGAFQVSGSNGYTLNVVAEPPQAGRRGSILLDAVQKGMGAIYKVPASVTETSMQSDLGGLGEISVTFHRSNQPAKAPCGERKVQFDSGEYEGKIEFHGEDGYTTVEADSAPGSVPFYASCGGGFFESGPARRPRGAELYVRNPALGPQLSIRKSRPGAAAQFFASTSEYVNGMVIRRYVSRQLPSRDFLYNPRLRTATLDPAPPFAGSARFDRGKKAGRRWIGDLTVDLPGRVAVPLTGPTLRAFLVPSE
jgi:hypothetical protein